MAESRRLVLSAAAAAAAAAVIWAWGLGAPLKNRPRKMTTESQTGGSMMEHLEKGRSAMERLPPEIISKVLSYLGYQALCCFSMTNSAMRIAGRDENIWNALFHKDFIVDQDSITPINGWKPYYAATKKVPSVNANFFKIITDRSALEMGRFWLDHFRVKCIHGTGGLHVGHQNVIDWWAAQFRLRPTGVSIEVRDIRALVVMDMAWVTMKAHAFNMDDHPFDITNIFELSDTEWYMVYHHSSVGFINRGVINMGEAVEIHVGGA